MEAIQKHCEILLQEADKSHKYYSMHAHKVNVDSECTCILVPSPAYGIQCAGNLTYLQEVQLSIQSFSG